MAELARNLARATQDGKMEEADMTREVLLGLLAHYLRAERQEALAAPPAVSNSAPFAPQPTAHATATEQQQRMAAYNDDSRNLIYFSSEGHASTRLAVRQPSQQPAGDLRVMLETGANVLPHHARVCGPPGSAVGQPLDPARVDHGNRGGRWDLGVPTAPCLARGLCV